MDPSAISQWLSSDKNWETGLAIFLHFGTHRSLKKRFTRTGYNHFNSGLLYEEMINLARFHSTASKPSPAQLPARRQKVAPAASLAPNSVKSSDAQKSKPGPVSASLETGRIKIEFDILPESLKKLHTKKGILFNEASKLHKTLDTSTQEQRAFICEEIIAKMEENKVIWDELEYFMLNHKIKGAHHSLSSANILTDVNDLSGEQLLRRLNNRRTNVSRYKKRILDNPSDIQGNKKREAKLAEWSIEINTLQKLLKSDAV